MSSKEVKAALLDAIRITSDPRVARYALRHCGDKVEGASEFKAALTGHVALDVQLRDVLNLTFGDVLELLAKIQEVGNA